MGKFKTVENSDANSPKKKKEDLTLAKYLIPELKHFIKRVFSSLSYNLCFEGEIYSGLLAGLEFLQSEQFHFSGKYKNKQKNLLYH